MTSQGKPETAAVPAPAPAPTTVRIGRSPIRVVVHPPATLPDPARYKRLADAVRSVLAESSRSGE